MTIAQKSSSISLAQVTDASWVPQTPKSLLQRGCLLGIWIWMPSTSTNGVFKRRKSSAGRAVLSTVYIQGISDRMCYMYTFIRAVLRNVYIHTFRGYHTVYMMYIV